MCGGCAISISRNTHTEEESSLKSVLPKRLRETNFECLKSGYVNNLKRALELDMPIIIVATFAFKLYLEQAYSHGLLLYLKPVEQTTR
jgi:hypothetical protein